MKGVYDVRRENLRALIAEKFSARQVEFAEHMEYEPSFVSRLLSERKGSKQNIGNKLARDIETRVGLETNWLDVPHSELRRVAQARGEYNVEEGPPMRQRVPLLTWAQACKWREVMEKLTPGAQRAVDTTAVVSRHAYALKITGDSMMNPNGAPTFPEGMLIIVDPDKTAEPGSFVVVRQAGHEECTFKQLVQDGDRRYLKPLNPRYPILEMGPNDEICGVAVQAVVDL
jgi:SOS-response transcriptional repressor LexA